MNPFDMMKNMKVIQEKILEFQQKLPEMVEIGESGGGMVKVSVDGTFQVRTVIIDPAVIDPKDHEFLQDLITSASRAAHAKMKDKIAAEMSSMTGGMGIPPGMLGI